jgi:Ca-activated chloride channel family protein
MSGRDFERTIPVTFSRRDKGHDVLATLWARTRIADLMSQDFAGIQSGSPNAEVKDEITQLGLDYRLMTQFTSFVAVEERMVTEGGRPRRIDVPVEMPQGVSYEGVFGEKGEAVGGRAMGQSLAVNKQFRGYAADSVAPTSPRIKGPRVEQEAQREIHNRPNLPKPAGEPAAQDFRAKLHPGLAAIVAAGQPGKVEIEVWLADATPETLAELKKLGFEPVGTPKVAKIIGGRIDIGKVEALARLANVRYIKLLTL